jgi:hypothetical protein
MFALALAFLLELAGLVGLAAWGWSQHTGAARFAWAIGLPLLAAAGWGIFRVEGDPGHAPVRIPGPLRLALEFGFYALATWAFYAAGWRTVVLVFLALIILDYALLWKHVVWKFHQ